MATSPPTCTRSWSSDRPRQNVRYRTSCDRCQNFKVKCSQEKPACNRCAKRGLDCIYSPLRRMGRPRKSTHRSSLNESPAGETPLHEAFTPATSNTSAGVEQGGNPELIASHPGITSTTDTSSTQQDSLGSWSSVLTNCELPITDNNSMNNDEASIYPRQPVSTISSGDTGSHPPMDSGTRHLSMGTYIDNEMHNNHDTAYTPQEAQFSALLEPYTRPQCESPQTNNCYVAILSRITKLERSLTSSLNPPPIDIILSAEHDFRALKHILFTCTGHTSAVNPQARLQPCLSSSRPALLSLALLAERIVSVFMAIFQRAASIAFSRDRTIQNSSWSGTQVTTTSAQRLGRSFRSLLGPPCVFPVPETCRDVKVGEYLIDRQIRARVTKRILLRRVKKVLDALKEMSAVPRREADGSSADGPLDWGGCDKVLDDAAEALVKDLIKRVEALQGGMVLVG